MPSLAVDLEFRGLVHQITDPGLLPKLDAGGMTVYAGFDPTADSLHVGSLLQLCTLRRLQRAGHRPIALAGGATGVVGDPGGKTEERPFLSDEQLRANLEGIRPQLERFLDFSADAGSSRAILVDNADWFREMRLLSFMREVGKHITVNQMIAKESVRSRIDRPDHGISFTEFSYMLLQGYDFMHLFDLYGCTLQIGGSDQWGNITVGTELIRKVRGEEVFGLTTPLVLKADGTKFGKTESGNVWLDARRTSPYQLYQFLLRSDDAVVGSYLRYLTFLDHPTILELDEQTKTHPEARSAQTALAREVCTIVHGEAQTAKAERAAGALFSEKISSLDEATFLEVCADAPSIDVARNEFDTSGLSLVDALVRTGLARSKSQARTTIGQGGAYVNNRRVGDPDARLGSDDLIYDRYVVLRRGRRDYHLLRFV
ncbi:MAG TPA: tyrosine--tRNA ligase [Acidimicrobiales bacterium]|nr:tyrosine--tRNA ligase [Acidimicrobiales bacterium]